MHKALKSKVNVVRLYVKKRKDEEKGIIGIQFYLDSSTKEFVDYTEQCNERLIMVNIIYGRTEKRTNMEPEEFKVRSLTRKQNKYTYI